MAVEFSERLANMRNEDLIRIAQFGDQDGFEPAAIAAAQAELDGRGVSASDVAQVLGDADVLRRMAETKHLVPLGWGGRILFAISAPLILPMIGAVVLSARGYARKSREAWLSILAGYGLWIAVPMILFVLGDVVGL